jgi:hypothetical protein
MSAAFPASSRQSRSRPRLAFLAALCASFATVFPAVQFPDSGGRGPLRRTIVLAWDASPDPGVTGYYLLVGSASRAYVERIDVGNVTTFEFLAADSGQPYYFAVAAYTADRSVSEPSNEVVAPAAWPVPDPRGSRTSETAARRTQDGGDAVRRLCFVPQAGECYEARVLARVSGELSSLVATDEGRIFFVQDGRTVRVVAPDGLLEEPALTSSMAPRRRLEGLVAHPDFSWNRYLYVAEVTEEGTDGELSLTRYREIGNRLGEPAKIVSGLSTVGPVRLTVDGAGRVYVAIPSRRGSAGSPFDGMILRFNPDGTTPRESRAGSPVLARGFDLPSGLEWDPDGERLRLSGMHPEWPYSVAHIPLEGWEAMGWAPEPLPDTVVPGLEGRSLRLEAVASSTVPGSDPAIFLLDEEHRLLRVTRRKGGYQAPEIAWLQGPTRVVAAAAGADRKLFLIALIHNSALDHPIFEILGLP